MTAITGVYTAVIAGVLEETAFRALPVSRFCKCGIERRITLFLKNLKF